MSESVLDIPFALSDGTQTSLRTLGGKCWLVVNTASKCGFTPQYKALQALWQAHHDQGLMIVGFPCNQFGGQEPGSDAEIRNFCTLNYEVSFPLAQKIEVNGNNSHPLYVMLKKQAPGLLGSQAIKWNFTKFLLTADGRQIKRFASATKPEQIETEIIQALS